MSRTYSQLIDLVRSWSNRDSEVLNNSIIADCLRYAADKAYRRLRVPPLENTVTYTAESLMAGTSSSNNRFSSVTELAIPADLIEFIQIREIDEVGRTTRIFNEKADVRTFNDQYAEKYNDFAFWTRQGDCVLLSPAFGNTGSGYGSSGTGLSDALEMYYYRRLPALYARYNVSAANANLGLNTVQGTDPLPTPVEGTDERIPTGRLRIITNANGTETFEDVPEGSTDGLVYYGNAVPNWLRDENERVLLMGALAEVFFYLQENEEAQKYAALFTQEIQELNDEDKQRDASGGNVQINFNGRGLI